MKKAMVGAQRGDGGAKPTRRHHQGSIMSFYLAHSRMLRLAKEFVRAARPLRSILTKIRHISGSVASRKASAKAPCHARHRAGNALSTSSSSRITI